MVQKFCPGVGVGGGVGGGGHVWGHQRSKSRIWGPFFDCHTTPPRLFELEP